MPFDLALPIASAAVALLAVATYVGGPRIRMRTYNRVHNGLRVVEVAFMLTRGRRALRAGETGSGAARPATEFVIYLTLKTASRC
jgi:hypothetical protein